MSRFARNRRVFFFEEPEIEDLPTDEFHLRTVSAEDGRVLVCTPIVPRDATHDRLVAIQRVMLDELIASAQIENFVAWYYTPMAREFSRHLRPEVCIYDCMDELSAFAGAPPAMQMNERDLFAAADLVFTGGASLYDSKCRQHDAVYAFPSSVDVTHFARAREPQTEPLDQRNIPHPRLGYAGVIDERMDLDLLREVSRLRPHWQFMMVGPVIKIDPSVLPHGPNLHYLGMKSYADLPAYFSGWSIGMLPFAMNESTRFISPTKTPEYLAAGLRVVSTPISDVMSPYGDLGLVEIAGTAREFVTSVDSLLARAPESGFEMCVDSFLARSSWDKTWNAMDQLIQSRVRSTAVGNAGTAEGAVLEGTHV